MNLTLIPLSECCLQLGIEETFVLTLEERGLTHTVTQEQSIFIDASELLQLEKMARLHHELDINIEGIEAIMHLLERIELLQEEIASLANRLQSYE